jgi:hypothetical protein
MIFTKRVLVESVLNEVSVEDVMGDKWLKDTSQTMDAEFYASQAAEFWNEVDTVLETLKQDSPEVQKKWAYDQGWDESIIKGFPQLMNMIDLKYLKSKLSDKQVYEMMQEGGIGSGGNLLRFAEKVVAKLLTRYLF